MKGLFLTGGSLCFLSLIWGALSGSIFFMLIPAALGWSCIGIASWYQHKLEQKAASWRATYPSYKY